MINVATFRHNIYYENTYILYDQTKECIIVDPGCYTIDEKAAILDYLAYYQLKPVMIVNTHCHIDHVFGNKLLLDLYKVPLALHKHEIKYLEAMPAYAKRLGFEVAPVEKKYSLLEEGTIIRFGNSALEVLHTPGHTPGSISLYCSSQKILISGDVIFRNRIGKVDLPGGDLSCLTKIIKEKVFSLEDDVVIYPGHGPVTNVKDEKQDNPFIPGIF